MILNITLIMYILRAFNVAIKISFIKYFKWTAISHSTSTALLQKKIL